MDNKKLKVSNGKRSSSRRRNRLNLREILFMVKRGFSYSDLLSMPVHTRRYFVQYMIELENE